MTKRRLVILSAVCLSLLAPAGTLCAQDELKKDFPAEFVGSVLKQMVNAKCEPTAHRRAFSDSAS